MAETVAPQKPIRLAHAVAVFAGNGLEFYDFLSYALFSVYIGKAFFPAHDPSISTLLSLATFRPVCRFLTRRSPGRNSMWTRPPRHISPCFLLSNANCRIDISKAAIGCNCGKCCGTWLRARCF